jgi:hypothetical protein
MFTTAMDKGRFIHPKRLDRAWGTALASFAADSRPGDDAGRTNNEFS